MDCWEEFAVQFWNVVADARLARWTLFAAVESVLMYRREASSEAIQKV